MSVTITSPANDGDPFPATILGTYAGAPGSPKISVAVTDEGSGASSLSTARVVPGPGGGSGTWSLTKPSNLTPGDLYTITATLNGASDTKLHIQN